MQFRMGLLAAVAAGAWTVPAYAEVVSGTGRATITKDLETVRNQAKTEAKRQLVVAMLSAAIGGDRLREVSPEVIAKLADQVRQDMITNQTAEREGQTFVLTLTADIDGAWFRQQLDNQGIDSSSHRADNDRQLLVVMLDQEDSVGSDLAKPAEETVEYDRSTGESYRDHSTLAASSRSSAASASRSASASSSSSAAAYQGSSSGAVSDHSSGSAAASGRNGSFGASQHNNVTASQNSQASGAASQHAASARVSQSASAQSSSASLSARASVDSETHDDVHFRSHVVYQRPAAASDGDAIVSALKGSLGDYGVTTADAWQPLSTFFAGQPPRYNALKTDTRYKPFLASLQASNAPFFMGGTFRVIHSDKDPATGQARCSGSLNASAFATSDGRDLASGLFNAVGSGMSPEECGQKLAASLAGAAAVKMGPRIQNYWRSVARASVGQDSSQTADYTLVLRAPKLDMAMQADIMDALQATQGVQSQNFVSQSPTEIRLTVRYAGGTPLQFALYQKLRNLPAYAGLQATAEGRGILLCVGPCGGK